MAAMMSNREVARDNLKLHWARHCQLVPDQRPHLISLRFTSALHVPSRLGWIRRLSLEAFRLDIDLLADQFPVVVAFPAYFLFDEILFGSGVAPGIHPGGVAYDFNTPNQVCETTSRTGIHVTGEQVAVFGMWRQNLLSIAKSRAVPRFMTMSTNESGGNPAGFCSAGEWRWPAHLRPYADT